MKNPRILWIKDKPMVITKLAVNKDHIEAIKKDQEKLWAKFDKSISKFHDKLDKIKIYMGTEFTALGKKINANDVAIIKIKTEKKVLGKIWEIILKLFINWLPHWVAIIISVAFLYFTIKKH